MPVHPLAERAFGTMAEAYERGRPGWPDGAITPWLDRGATVLDLAAGTGKLTERLVERAGRVIAVEPVDGMRRVLAERLPAADVRAGTAEAIPVEDAAVDAAFVAEAFHWFDHRAAAAELARVVRGGGSIVLLWNLPMLEGVAWHDDLLVAFARHRIEETQGLLRDAVPWREALEAEERLGPLADHVVMHEHHTDREGLVAKVASTSAIGALSPQRRAAALADVRRVLEQHRIDEVAVPYRTLVTAARRR
jgi:ubiquinone/menaquinone biosynthesis C-methylase UbiE